MRHANGPVHLYEHGANKTTEYDTPTDRAIHPENSQTLERKNMKEVNRMDGLFDEVDIGAWCLPHRIVMAPLTRSRAGSARIPNKMMAEYYAQRASAALIITEATLISQQAAGYAYTPGIHNGAQVEGWKRIVDAVKTRNGHIVCQLWHCGRISHPTLQLDLATPVAPSAIKPGESAGLAFTKEGFRPFVTPRALEESEILAILNDYRQAAENVKGAGFDGVEIDGANGYLINQFLCDSTNRRTDRYGGSIENRTRFLLEVIDAVGAVWDADRIGVRISPRGAFLDCADSDDVALYRYVCKELSRRGLAYLSVVEQQCPGDGAGDNDPSVPTSITAFVRSHYHGSILTGGGYTRRSASAIVQAGIAQLVAFGKAYIANPDLAERIRERADMNEPDRDTFYGGDEKGYTDYPFMQKGVEV